MFMEERLQQIASMLKDKGKITIGEIAETYGISAESARRDLGKLEKAGLCQRTHGGAILPPQVSQCPPADRELALMPVYDNYRSIAQAAVNMIRPGDSVYLPGGSFGYIMATLLPKDLSCTVVVNHVDIAKALRPLTNLNVYLVGGKMRPNGSTVDSLATAFVSGLHFDLAFLTGGGLTGDFGLSNGTDETAAFQRAVLRNSRRKYLLLPGQKIGFNAFVKVCDAAEFDGLITDSSACPEQLTALEEAGLTVTAVEVSHDP